MPVPDRGDFVTIDFNPQSGHEQAGRRPAIVLSPQLFNQATGFAVICPITNQAKGYPFEIEVPNNPWVTGVVLTDQIKSLDWNSRSIRILGQAPSSLTQDCLDYVRTFL